MLVWIGLQVAICNRLQLFATICNYLQLFAIICYEHDNMMMMMIDDDQHLKIHSELFLPIPTQALS